MITLLSRIRNLFHGLFGLFVGGLERRNPAAVYEAALEGRLRQYQKLRDAVGGLVYHRNRIAAELSHKRTRLEELAAELPLAVDAGNDAVALVLIEQRDQLTAQVDELKKQLEKHAQEAEESKQALLQFQGEIEKLRRERDAMLAKKASAEARLTLQKSMEGLSTEGDLRALDNVRESIAKLQAQSDVSAELAGASLEGELEAVRQRMAGTKAQGELTRLKAARLSVVGQKTLG